MQIFGALVSQKNGLERGFYWYLTLISETKMQFYRIVFARLVYFASVKKIRILIDSGFIFQGIILRKTPTPVETEKRFI